MKYLLLCLLLFSCYNPTAPLWFGCYEIKIGETSTRGTIHQNGGKLFIAEYELDVVSVQGQSIVATRTLQSGTATSTTEFRLINFGTHIGGIVIKHTYGTDCDTRDTLGVYCSQVPCDSEGNN